MQGTSTSPIRPRACSPSRGQRCGAPPERFACQPSPCASNVSGWQSTLRPRASRKTKLAGHSSSDRLNSESAAHTPSTSSRRTPRSRSSCKRVCSPSSASTPQPPSIQNSIPAERSRPRTSMTSFAFMGKAASSPDLRRPLDTQLSTERNTFPRGFRAVQRFADACDRFGLELIRARSRARRPDAVEERSNRPPLAFGGAVPDVVKDPGEHFGLENAFPLRFPLTGSGASFGRRLPQGAEVGIRHAARDSPPESVVEPELALDDVVDQIVGKAIGCTGRASCEDGAVFARNGGFDEAFVESRERDLHHCSL